MLNKKNLRKNVPLPPGLDFDSVYNALKKTKNLFSKINAKTGVILSQIIQANNFSGIVSNVFTKMLDECSSYKKLSDQEYPDLRNPQNGEGLEVKATKNPFKGGEGHNGHSGWHIIVCYTILDNGDIDFSQIEIAKLIGFGKPNTDWEYNPSKRNSNDSQRTETYATNIIGTSKLRDGTIYFDPEYCSISKQLRTMRKKINLAIPSYSIFAE